jgi:G3E family GTPase
VDPDIIFGIDSKLFLDEKMSPAAESSLHDEVETVTLSRGAAVARDPNHVHTDACGHDHSTIEQSNEKATAPLTLESLETALTSLSKESVWRVKGFLKLSTGDHILNWAFGRYELTPYSRGLEGDIKLTIMGERGEGLLNHHLASAMADLLTVRRAAQKLAALLYADIS